MNKAILISIQAMWTGYIADLYKTIEVRKERPKQNTPFKCYIYETKGKQIIRCEGRKTSYCGRGKVIGEFVCDKIYAIADYCHAVYDADEGKEYETLLAVSDFADYGKGKQLYGWRISELKIYDKPKEIWEFNKFLPCELSKQKCGLDGFDGLNRGCEWCAMKTVVCTPPQSWFYVEELEQ